MLRPIQAPRAALEGALQRQLVLKAGQRAGPPRRTDAWFLAGTEGSLCWA